MELYEGAGPAFQLFGEMEQAYPEFFEEHDPGYGFQYFGHPDTGVYYAIVTAATLGFDIADEFIERAYTVIEENWQIDHAYEMAQIIRENRTKNA